MWLPGAEISRGLLAVWVPDYNSHSLWATDILICLTYHHIFTLIIIIDVAMTFPWYFLHFDILHAHITNIFNF